jgi:ribonuclease HI
MELLGAIMALRTLKRPSKVALHTDARYVRDAFEEGWIEKWQSNGWRTSARKPVENQDLWRDLIELSEVHDITWHWVPGHADVIENNRCDELAVAAREALRDHLGATDVGR